MEDRAFAVGDRDDIAYVTIERNGYPFIHLSKNKNSWHLNEKRKVQQNYIDNLLSILTRLEVNTVPSRSQRPKILRDLKEHGIKVKAYDDDGKILTDFMLGKDSATDVGSYCLLTGAQQPYLMRVPAITGGIRTYFLMEEMDMRDKTVYNYEGQKIKSISVDYKRDQNNSFMIQNTGSNYSISALLDDHPIDLNQNQNILNAYFKDFNKLGAEAIYTGDPSMDSLRQYLPFMELKVELNNSQVDTFFFYPVDQVTNKEKSYNTLQDINRVMRHFMFSSDGEVYLVQHPLVKKHFKGLAYFNR